MFSETIGLYPSSSLIFSICQSENVFRNNWALYIILFNLLNLSDENVFRSNWALFLILFHLLDLSSESVFRSNWALYLILFHPNTLALR